MSMRIATGQCFPKEGSTAEEALGEYVRVVNIYLKSDPDAMWSMSDLITAHDGMSDWLDKSRRKSIDVLKATILHTAVGVFLDGLERDINKHLCYVRKALWQIQ